MEKQGDLLDGWEVPQRAAKPASVRVRKRSTKVTAQAANFIEMAVEIASNPDKIERAYIARQLVQCTLPHSNPGNVPVWTRRNGSNILSLQQGVVEGELVGYPYGTLPRLLMFWVVTEAVQKKERKLELGKSLASFMRELGLDPNTGGGKRSDAKRLRDQMQRLFNCRITFDIKDLVRADGAIGKRHRNMEIVVEEEYWWSPHDPSQTALWGSFVILGEQFFEAITTAPIPADMRALRLLKRSPLALDLYTLSIHKAYIANKYHQGQFLTWDTMLMQLGAEYDRASIRQFKTEVKNKLRKVHMAFPSGLKYEFDRNGKGITFMPGTRMPVAPRPSLPKTGR